jgi:hypothetical protein
LAAGEEVTIVKMCEEVEMSKIMKGVSDAVVAQIWLCEALSVKPYSVHLDITI